MASIRRQIVSLAIVVAGCGSIEPLAPSVGPSTPLASESGESAAPSPIDLEALAYDCRYSPSPGTSGGHVTIGSHVSATQLHPYLTNVSVDAEVYAATMPTLLTVCTDGHWLPWLSDGPITYADDVREDEGPSTGFTVHVAIKRNLRWSDGVPFNLDDMRYTWAAVLDAADGGLGIEPLGWDQVDRIDVSADGMEADVHFKAPYVNWLAVVGSNFILPEHYMTSFAFEDWRAAYRVSPDLTGAVTLGPFKYAAVTADTIELVRDDNWAGPAEACGGNACLDAVTFRTFPDDKERLIAAFLNGDVDLALSLTQGVDDTRIDPSLLITEPSLWRYEHLDFNQAGLGKGRGHPALQDLVVRQAIAQAIDRKAMWEAVFPGAPYSIDEPCTFATPTNYWRLPDARCLPYDLAAAKKRLDDAGYSDTDGDGVREMPDGGTPLEFEHCTLAINFRVAGSEFIARSLQSIGIRLNVTPVDGADVLFADWAAARDSTKCNLAHGNYDTSEFAYLLTLDPFSDSYYSYHTEQIPTDANGGIGYNYLRFSNTEMDAALDTLESAIRTEDQVTAAYAVQQVYIDQVPEVVLYYPNTSLSVSVRLHNVEKNPSIATEMWNIADWWLTK